MNGYATQFGGPATFHGTNTNASGSGTPTMSDGGPLSASIASEASSQSYKQDQTTAATSAASSFASGAADLNQSAAGPSTGLLQHIYQAGFCDAQWHDCVIHFQSILGFTRSFRLHSLIISRSSLLRHHLLSSPIREAYVHLPDPNISDEALPIALGHLYGASTSSLITAENATAVLAAAYFLQIDDLAQLAHGVIKASLSAENVQQLVAFSRATIDVQQQPNQTVASASKAPLRYGPYSEDLSRATAEYLSKTLPAELGAFTPQAQASAQEQLIKAYSTLDFELFQSIAQSPHLAVKSVQERFNFIKKCIAARKKALGSSLGEEQVVLAFTGPGSGGVQVLRKPARKLSKIGPHANSK